MFHWHSNVKVHSNCLWWDLWFDRRCAAGGTNDGLGAGLLTTLKQGKFVYSNSLPLHLMLSVNTMVSLIVTLYCANKLCNKVTFTQRQHTCRCMVWAILIFAPLEHSSQHAQVFSRMATIHWSGLQGNGICLTPTSWHFYKLQAWGSTVLQAI